MNEEFSDIILYLVIFFLAVLEIRRGWIILFKKEVAYFTGIPLLFWVLDFFEFDELRRKIETNLSEPKNQKSSGLIGLTIGALLITGCMFFLIGVLAELFST